MAWPLAAAAIGSSVLGGIFGDRAASRQAQAAREATQLQVDEQRRQYDQTRRDFTPYREFGYDALGQLQDPEGNFMRSNYYDFIREEGMRGIENRASVGGLSGRTLASMADYGTNLAGGFRQQWENNMLNRANIGMGAAANTANAGMNAANAMGAAYARQGENLAAAAGTRYGSYANAARGAISNALYAADQGWFSKKPSAAATAPRPVYDFQSRRINYGD